MSQPKLVAMDVSIPVFTGSQSADAAYPFSNLNSGWAADQWKSANTINDQYLYIDLGLGPLLDGGRDCCVIDNSNFQTLIDNGGGVSLQRAITSDFGTGLQTVVSNVLTTGSGNVPTYFEFSLSNSCRYYRIAFSTTLSEPPKLGQIFIGRKADLGFPPDLPNTQNVKGYETTTKIALDGRIRTAQPYAGRRRWVYSFGGDRGGLSDANKALFQQFFALVRGKLRPFYLVDVDGLAYYVHLDTDVDPTQIYRYNINDLRNLTMLSQLVD